MMDNGCAGTMASGACGACMADGRCCGVGLGELATSDFNTAAASRATAAAPAASLAAFSAASLAVAIVVADDPLIGISAGKRGVGLAVGGGFSGCAWGGDEQGEVGAVVQCPSCRPVAAAGSDGDCSSG